MSERDAPRRAGEEEPLQQPQTGITLMDLLRAVFMPEGMAERWERPARLPRPVAGEPSTAEDSQPPGVGDVATAGTPSQMQVGGAPVQISLQTYAASPAHETVIENTTFGNRLALVLGTGGALLLGYLAQRALTIGRRDTLGVALYALALFLWLAMLLYEFGPSGDRWAWLPQRQRRAPDVVPPPGDSPGWFQRVLSVEPSRLYLVATGLTLSALTYLATANNRFTFIGVVAWLGSIAAWVIALSEGEVPPQLDIFGRLWAWLRRPALRMTLQPFAFLIVLVVLLGAFFRFARLDAVPPEMTSDHVEKLLDAHRVQQGQYFVFFPNNGGREAIQMYLVALVAELLGTGMSFTSLKLVSGLEGLALIPVMVVLGHELFDRQTGLLAGLLLAMSWWHTSLSRMGLRIALTPLVMAFVLIHLARGLRSGERRPFIAVGFWLGVGVYSYQALRIAPLVVAAGVLFAMLRPGTDWRWRRRLLGHLVVAGVIALVIFVPMARFWADSPEALWGRVINRTTSSEVAIGGNPLVILGTNLAKALLMFNWQGDIAWISAIPGAPLLDVVSGFLFILGVIAWAVRLVLRRDPLDGLVPLAILIMLLPSAFSIAFPVENPSATRASGVIPLVYLLAAWPVTLIWRRWMRVLGGTGRRLALAVFGILGLVAALFNYDAYFHRYLDSYRRSALNPGEVAAAVAGFADSIGSLDNAYLQGYPFWHDYRAIGIEAGDITWANAILDADHLTAMLADDPRLTDGSAKLFVVHPDDTQAREILRAAYPEGQFILKSSAVPDHDFYIFVVPAAGQAVESEEAPS